MGSTCGCVTKVPAEHQNRPRNCQDQFTRIQSKSTLSLDFGDETLPFFSDATTVDTTTTTTTTTAGGTELEPTVNHHQITSAFIAAIIRDTCKLEKMPSPVLNLCCSYFHSPRPLRRKRVVFTSIFQLNACIDRVPSYILDESIFLFKVRDRMQLLSSAPSYKLHPLLMQYLDKQRERGLLLVLDNRTTWTDISGALTQLRDLWFHDREHMVTYKPLKLASAHWQQHTHQAHTSQYGARGTDVLREIESGALKFAPSMELLWQSNATLIPMTSFDHEQYVRCNATMHNNHDHDDILHNHTALAMTMEDEDGGGGSGGGGVVDDAYDDDEEYSCAVSSCDDCGELVILSTYGEDHRPKIEMESSPAVVEDINVHVLYAHDVHTHMDVYNYTYPMQHYQHYPSV